MIYKYIALLLVLCHNICTSPRRILLNLHHMKDINTHLAPVLNLSDRSVEESFALACGFPLSKVLLEDFERTIPVNIPVRIIEGMEEIVERKTVNVRQAFLI